MLKDDLLVIDELLYDDDSTVGCQPAWERIKKFIEEAQNKSTNSAIAKSTSVCTVTSCVKCGFIKDSEICLQNWEVARRLRQ